MVIEHNSTDPVLEKVRKCMATMNKSKLNYWVDVCIGITFVMSAASGLVFLLPVDFG